MDREQKWVYRSGKHLNICLPQTKLNLEGIMKRSSLRNCIQEIEMGKETINSNAFSGASSSLTLPFPVLVCIHNFCQGEIQSSNITSGSCLYSCCKTTEHSCDFTGVVTKTQQRGSSEQWRTKKPHTECLKTQVQRILVGWHWWREQHQREEVWGLSAHGWNQKCVTSLPKRRDGFVSGLAPSE